MKNKEVKRYYKSGQLERHHLVDRNDDDCGECRIYHGNGKLWWHKFSLSGCHYGEVKWFSKDGTLCDHYLVDSEGNELATVIENDKPSTHSEEELIQIAKDNNLPLLSELPKTEAELTHWNLKYPDFPCLPNESE